MPTTFANTIDGNEILAKRSQCDYAGNDIATTYATKSEIPSVPVTDVEVDGVSVVSSGVASIAMPTVDQTYNASSTNAQSGTAVAGAIAGIDEVPAVTSSDDGKVLKATYSGGSGSYAWDTDSDTTYTAGNMIAIDSNNNNAIGVSTTAGITDIQQVNALPANPVSTVLYLIPET